MSLICGEKGRDIEFGEPLVACQIPGRRSYTALCKEAIDIIPARLKNKKQRRPGEAGFNVYKATASRNFNGSYALCDFTLREFSFSISDKTATTHLPEIIKLYETYNLP